MKRFFTLSFLFFSFVLLGQNLIPDPSVEDFVECPSSLGNIEVYTSFWKQFRGSPDYWNSCSENPLLGWNNSLGFQEPRTGNGYLGLFTFHQGLTNARESFGIELENPLEIGQAYFLSFHVSAAYQPSGFNMTSNNIGALLMVDNYLNEEEQGSLPNYANFNLSDLMTDTTNWVNVSYSFVSDSAYRFLCFGNFFVDNLTDTLRLEGEDGNAIAYYYFDDFCLSTDSSLCDIITNTSTRVSRTELSIYPNPASNILHINTDLTIIDLEIHSITGDTQTDYKVMQDSKKELELSLSNGLYVISIYSKKGVVNKRFVVQ